MSVPPRLQLTAVSKSYGATPANKNIDLTVAKGEIHGLLGENGAGKSTLMKLIYGIVRPDQGEIRIDGEAVQITSPKHARSLGIGMVFQHFSLFDSLTVAQNILLGLGRDWTMAQVLRELTLVDEQYGLTLNPTQIVDTLSLGECQRIEIVRALLTNPKLLILDEPTSVLAPPMIERLHKTLKQLAQAGTSIIYISHKLPEIMKLTDRVTVLRAGKVVGQTQNTSDTDASTLIRQMVGEWPNQPTLHFEIKNPILQVQDLYLPATEPIESSHNVTLGPLSFEVREGEILGIAGMSGNGQQLLLAALSGEWQGPLQGSLKWFPKATGVATNTALDLTRYDVRGRRKLGIRYVPENRLTHGAVAQMTLTENTLLTRCIAPLVTPWGRLQRGAQKDACLKITTDYNVKSAGPESLASTLSGGNLQKFILGREVSASPRLLILAQPSWGVDVKAAALIHEEILKLQAQGNSVLLVSEDLDEIFNLCDRVHVMVAGRLSAPFSELGAADRDEIGELMSGERAINQTELAVT